MRFNLENELHQVQARQRLEFLINKGANAELTEKREKRTLNQNSYFYLILTAWGLELGMTRDEMKQLLKKNLMPDMFKYVKKNEVFYRSTRDLNTKEMTEAIDKIRQTAMESTGYYIPTPDEQGLVEMMQNEVDKFKE